MKRITRRAEEPVLDSAEFKLDTAQEAAKDALVLMRDKQRREQRSLADYTASDDEITARHEIREVHNHTHVNVSMPSQPDHDSDAPQIEIGPLKARNLPKWLVVTLAAIVAAGTALLARLSSR